ncbi:hypothetical protein M0R19_06235 [Candidatus Pacearchaeota archaeon]|jgi:hypothetical protein|nr:hypothetical protein [Candidatus Pacearchaeota archaeon]
MDNKKDSNKTPCCYNCNQNKNKNEYHKVIICKLFQPDDYRLKKSDLCDMWER